MWYPIGKRCFGYSEQRENNGMREIDLATQVHICAAKLNVSQEIYHKNPAMFNCWDFYTGNTSFWKNRCHSVEETFTNIFIYWYPVSQ